MSTLRGRMTQEIESDSWLDYSFERGDGIASKYNKDKKNGYRNYLNEMDDASFLSTYNRIRDAYNKLD